MSAAKIIFLDFDGPLSNHRTALATGDMKAFDPQTIAIVNVICELSGARIVCTSTRAPASDPVGKDRIMRRFAGASLDLNHIHEDWSCRYDNGPRENHIACWLSRHPEVVQSVTVDDKPVKVSGLVLVDRYNGLTVQNAIQIMEALGVDPQAVFDRIARQSSGSEDPSYRARRIKLPPVAPS